MILKMKFRSVCRLIILSAIAASVVACGDNDAAVESTSNDCQKIEHDRSTTEVCNQPQKIVAIGPNMLELLLALDIQPVGYADYFALPADKFDRPTQQIPFLGERITSNPVNVGTADNPNLETIAQLQPDLILGGVASNKDEYDLLSQIAPTLLFTYAVDDGWQDQIRTIAKAVGKTETAEEVINEHSKRIAQTKQALQPIVAQHPRFLLIGSEELSQGIQIDPYNHDSFCSGLLEDVGFEMVFPPDSKEQEGVGGNVSLEVLSQLQADSIMVQGYNSKFNDVEDDLLEHQTGKIKQQWNNNAIAQSLDASKSDRIYFSSAYLCRALPGSIGTETFLEQLQEQLLN